MNKRELKKLHKDKEFMRLIQKNGLMKKEKHTLLILILLALIVYLIFTKASIYLVIGLTVLFVLLMR